MEGRIISKLLLQMTWTGFNCLDIQFKGAVEGGGEGVEGRGIKKSIL
jgi:hypothetical protein